MTIRQKRWLRLGMWLLVIAWMGVIAAFSLQTAADSSETSGRVVRWLLARFDSSFLLLSPEAQLLRIEAWSFAVRKLAHFTLFAVMGFLSFVAFSVDLPPRRAFIGALGLGAVRAILDEVQQAFIPGRSCEVRDMGIDAAGVLLGASVLPLVLYCVRRRKQRKN